MKRRLPEYDAKLEADREKNVAARKQVHAGLARLEEAVDQLIA